MAGRRLHQFDKQALLQGQYLVFRAEYLLFVFFQLLRDVSLGVRQGLLAHPLGRHLVAIGVTDFDVVTKDVVVADFETTDSRGFCLTLLHVKQVFFAR